VIDVELRQFCTLCRSCN